jgi:hypothetical protein
MRDSEVETESDPSKIKIDFTSALSEIARLRTDIEKGRNLDNNFRIIRGEIGVCLSKYSDFEESDLVRKVRFANMEERIRGADKIFNEIKRTADSKTRGLLLNGIIRLLE